MNPFQRFATNPIAPSMRAKAALNGAKITSARLPRALPMKAGNPVKIPFNPSQPAVIAPVTALKDPESQPHRSPAPSHVKSPLNLSQPADIAARPAPKDPVSQPHRSPAPSHVKMLLNFSQPALSAPTAASYPAESQLQSKEPVQEKKLLNQSHAFDKIAQTSSQFFQR
jgi:hypothetical protein